MPIKNNIIVGNIENVCVAEFGTGDILVAPSGFTPDPRNVDSVCFFEQEAREIGEINNEINGKSTNEIKDKYQLKCMFIFKKVESIDILLEALEIVKESMLKSKEDDDLV